MNSKPARVAQSAKYARQASLAAVLLLSLPSCGLVAGVVAQSAGREKYQPTQQERRRAQEAWDRAEQPSKNTYPNRY